MSLRGVLDWFWVGKSFWRSRFFAGYLATLVVTLLIGIRLPATAAQILYWAGVVFWVAVFVASVAVYMPEVLRNGADAKDRDHRGQ